MDNLYYEISELAKTKNVKRIKHKDNQSFGDFVESAVIIFFMRHWRVEPINLGGPSPFDFEIIRDGKESFLVEVKSHNNDFDLPYFLYEVEDRGMIPCHFGEMMKKKPAGKKEFLVSVDCNLKKGGTLHIYPARELAKWCNTQAARSTKVNTRCVEVRWDNEIKGKRTVQLDEDIWNAIKKFKGEKK